MGRIVTFYSYKGGVGRSMALANVALLLARRGLRVLAVDWDLEAPGLERYFSGYFDIEPGGLGLLRMFIDARDHGTKVDYTGYTCSIPCDAPQPIVLLASGRDQDDAYSRNLETFDWTDFFETRGGGEFIEGLREQWRATFDVVLIDSRTGLSDTGGICTIQLPDIVVAMLTANFQSLYGVRDVLRLAQRARQGLAHDRMPITVLPLPARWGMQETRETQIWLGRVADAMQEFMSDWLPRPLTAHHVVERLKVPQRDYYGFGERLAVVEHGVSDPTGMGYVYDRVAAFIASDFADIRALLGDVASPLAPSVPAPAPIDDDSYDHDVFVSHSRADAEAALELVDALGPALGLELGRDANVYIDAKELNIGDSWADQLEAALLASRTLVVLLSPHSTRSEFVQREIDLFRRREDDTGAKLIAPVMLRKTELPRSIADRYALDVASVRAKSPAGSSMQFVAAELARSLGKMIRAAPLSASAGGSDTKRRSVRKRGTPLL
jgi:cellulose biosynthesis protein BcsQ